MKYNVKNQISYEGPVFQKYWSKDNVDLWAQAAKDRIFSSPYGRHVVERMQAAFDTHMNVKDKHILVIGSERPWIEAMLLAAGAQHVTSMDYTKLTTDHPRVCIF